MAKILLVEDDMPLLRLYESALQTEHTVSAVASSAEGIAAIEQERPDLVILDLNLPDAPGTQILNFIQNHAELSHLRVIVMTGFAAYQRENPPPIVTDVLNKPITTSTLLRVVHQALATNNIRF